MKIRPMDEVLAGVSAFDGIDPDDLATVAGCSRNEVVGAGTRLADEGDEDSTFYVVRDGLLALELHSPGRPLRIDTFGPGSVVGWSWIFPPYRWTADVVVVQQSRLVTVDGRCLRGKCEDDPAFGYRLMQRFATLMARELSATHLRLLDMYGGS